MLEVVQPIEDFIKKAEFIAVLENMRENDIFTPIVGYNFTEHMLAIIETDDSSHFLNNMVIEGILTYTQHQPTQFTRQHTLCDYLTIETVDMDKLSIHAQAYIENFEAPMAGRLAKDRIKNGENRKPSSSFS